MVERGQHKERQGGKTNGRKKVDGLETHRNGEG